MNTIQLGNHSLIIGDECAARTLDVATRAAKSSFPVLLCGPSGSGKELFARYIHLRSDRSLRPFVSVNCAAIPENLLEAELFGFERGSFTGAVSQRIGRFELASGGTLLLDEISEMQLSLQAKLLRALQENEIDRIGGRGPIPVDTRIIATSNREPVDLVKSGKFREDLYYRINVIRIDCPALKDRKEAIGHLARAFLNEWAERNASPIPMLSETAMERLATYPWPGNIRELKNTIERAIFNSDGKRVEMKHLEGTMQSAHFQPAVLGGTLADIEHRSIIQTLEETAGNRTHAAAKLGISVRTLRNKLKIYQGIGK
ncbi:MAG: sigma-54-dependent Fis family transcriptional regulator [Deltaproteobacteria bacterium]|nr:sigma-54-dependent Fis family transcriptional regulator [Deltaproteobacteria bacterium]MBI3295208.1 sigma-54-dependent Fis family transcriptional regulator [Deltaproteobacteria bacterium]